MNANPQKSRRKSIKFEPTIPKKLREARFFFNHMRQSAGSTRLDQEHEHFEFYLSAFLSAARSVTSFFEHNQKAWWSQWRANMSPDDRQLLNRMRTQRDNEVHEEGADVAHRIEEVPLSKIETASALHAAYAPFFGEPWGDVQVGLKVYYFRLGGKPVNAIETCHRYVGLLQRAVAEFSKA